MSIRNILIIAILIAMGGWTLYLQSLKGTAQQEISNTASPRMTNIDLEQNSTSQTLPPTNPAEGSLTAKQSTVVDVKTEILMKTGACDGVKPEADAINLIAQQIDFLKKYKYLDWISDGSLGCYAADKTYKFNLILRDGHSGKNFFKEVRGTLRLEKIELILGDQVAKYFNIKSQSEMPDFHRQFFKNREKTKKENEPVIVLRFNLDQFFPNRPSYGSPFFHPYAKTVSAEDVKKMMGEQTLIIDVRPADQFNLEQIPGSKNLNPKAYNELSRKILRSQPAKELSKNIQWAKIVSSLKPKQVVVYSNGPMDYSSYNALTILSSLNVKNLFWLRGGIDEWQGIRSLPPFPAHSVEILETVEKFLALQDAVVLDVRSRGEFQKRRFPDALNVEFVQNYKSNGMPLFRPKTIVVDQLNANKEYFVGPISFSKQKSVVVYGNNEYDWRPYKAIETLHTMGFKKILLFKYGIDGWTYGKKVQLNQAVKN